MGNKVCQCKCKKANCVQCDVNVGYAIGKFFNDSRVIDASLVGTITHDDKYIYIGKCDSETGGICDILVDKGDIEIDEKTPICDLEMQGGIKGEMSEYLQKWIDVNGGGEQTMEALKVYEQGKCFIEVFKPGSSITPIDKNISRNMIESKPKIKAVIFKLVKDDSGDVVREVFINTNVTIDDKRTFKLTEFVKYFSVGEYYTKGNAKYLQLTNSGVVKPVCIEYEGLKIMIDNVYVYKDDGHKTVPIGVWSLSSVKRSDELAKMMGDKKYKAIVDAIEALGRVRSYIAPYWCMKPNVVSGNSDK